MENLRNLYRSFSGHEPSSMTAISGSGSNREYFRIEGADEPLIGVIGENITENRAFISLSKHFSDRGINVPKVLKVSADERVYLQTYLGDTSLFDFIESGRNSGIFTSEQIDAIEKTVEALPEIQFRGAEGLDFKLCYPESEFNERLIRWDLNYFKYCFLKLAGVEFDESRLEDDFEHFAKELCYQFENTFMYRDFQSRNVMLKDGRPWFIDFQGGRRGPVEYDLASFLWQAKANFPAKLRDQMIEVYIRSARKFADFDADAFRARLPKFALFRMLQVLGAYGFRGIHEKKSHFIESIPLAARNASELLSDNNCYPELSRVIEQVKSKFPENNIAQQLPADRLTITVGSFSYKKGIPADQSGNGGGYVFDCRGMHNPGRYEQYKTLTGRDIPVIQFLEERGEVTQFLDSCYSLVDHSAETYLRRGFTSLNAWFGCTGGQHRSVYCAEHLAKHLAQRFPSARILLIHREQNIRKVFND